MLLQIDHEEIKPGIILIRLTGRVMLGAESQQIETLVSDLISQGRRNFVFDMSGVSHIDSTGIGRFISSFNKVREVSGNLRLAAAGGQVRDGFRVTRLDTVFQFYPDVESACEGLG
jgi:anti-anti-sigma factor